MASSSDRPLVKQPPSTPPLTSYMPVGVFGPLIHGPQFKLMKFLVTAKKFLNDPDLQTGPHTVGREEILKAVTETQEWFNENRQHATDSEVTEQFEKLKGVVMPTIEGQIATCFVIKHVKEAGGNITGANNRLYTVMYTTPKFTLRTTRMALIQELVTEPSSVL